MNLFTGLDEVGLFKDVDPAKVATLILKIDGGAKIEYGVDCDQRTTAHLLKKFISSLPSPLFSKKPKNATGIPTVRDIQDLLTSLPTANQHLLNELFALLYEVSLHAHLNQMPTDSLATTLSSLIFPVNGMYANALVII